LPLSYIEIYFTFTYFLPDTLDIFSRAIYIDGDKGFHRIQYILKLSSFCAAFIVLTVRP